MHKIIHTSFVNHRQNWKQLKLSINRKMDKYILTSLCNDVLPHTILSQIYWSMKKVDLKNLMLSKRSQTCKWKCLSDSIMWSLIRSKINLGWWLSEQWSLPVEVDWSWGGLAWGNLLLCWRCGTSWPEKWFHEWIQKKKKIINLCTSDMHIYCVYYDQKKEKKY